MPLQSKPTKFSSQTKISNSFLGRLSIRSSLLLGFGLVMGVMALAALASLFLSARLNLTVNSILEEQLPATIHTFGVAQAAEALAASGTPLSSLTSPKERDAAFKRIKKASISLDQALNSLRHTITEEQLIPTKLFMDLRENINRLQNIVEENIKLKYLQLKARKKLLLNLQTFQRHLTYRIRMIDGDGAVIHYLMSSPVPPFERIAHIANNMAQLLPVAHFYAEVESINGRLLTASQDPSLSELNTSREVIKTLLTEIKTSFNDIPRHLLSTLNKPFIQLQQLSTGEDGLINLRQKQLILYQESQNLNDMNRAILARVDVAASKMVQHEVKKINQVEKNLDIMRQKSLLIVFLATGLVLTIVIILVHFYDRHIITRLSWLSRAMQDIAAGRLNTCIPPAGSNELGRLGAALRQFRTNAAQTKEREAALQKSNKRAEQAMTMLKQKAVELELANARLQEISIRDPLTGLFNRRRFDEALVQEWNRAGHGGQDLGLLMLDIDYFKLFNDRYGHQAGDDCLRQVANIFISYSRRAGDVAARYGGEEFCLLCPYTNTLQAGSLAQDICRDITALGIPHEDSPFGVVTVSIGYVAALPDKSCSPENLVRAADKALYQAKSAGRNRTQEAAISCS